ncbi:MAG: protein kinase [Planctomycetes bacterium]|nr:protein kinase [Planctomycetota bacterium]
MAKLVCQSGPHAGHEYPLSKDVTVLGRSSDCDIKIADAMSSRAQCEVRRDGKLFTLVDGGSRNGTFLNEKKVTERPLTFGDRIRVGEVEYLLVKEAGDVELKDLLSKYDVAEKIGEGGMGIVYRATQKSMGRQVALKVLSPKYAARPRFVEQFIEEARAAGKLNHPNIVQVHDVGTENGIHYFSMELIEGRTCMEILREQGSFTVAEMLEIALQIGKALEYAHSQRRIHQDIKPDNIMVASSSGVKLADLGISKSFDEVATEGNSRRVMGTPHYMAPEAAMAKKIDHRVDIYSLGATLYHLLSGKPPYSGTSATDVLKAHVMEPLPPLQDLNTDVPDDVAAMIERMMAKNPDDRYLTATAIVEEVRCLQTGLGLGTERIASSDTMILRRLARGGDPSGASPVLAGGARRAGDKTGDTGQRSTRPRDPGMTTGSRTRGGEDVEPGSDRVRQVLIAGVVVLVIFMVGMFWPRGPTLPVPGPKSSPIPPSTSAATTTGGQAADPDPEPASASVDHAGDDRARAQAAELEKIERELEARGDRADLNALLARLNEPTLARVEPQNRARKKKLEDELAKNLERRRLANVVEAFGALEDDVGTLTREHNYDLALSRLAAFPGAGEASVAERLGTLRDRVRKDKDAYLANLSARTKQLGQSGDIDGLKELRDQLPPSLIGSALEQEIIAAITSLESASAARSAEVVKSALTELARWNLDKVRELHATHRKAMGDSAPGAQMDEHLRTVNGLDAFTAALATALQTAAPLRLKGDIGAFREPDLMDADARALKLRTSDGGIADVAWSTIKDDAIAAVAARVLKDRAVDHKAALDALKAARAAK